MKHRTILKLILIHVFFIFISFLMKRYHLSGPNLIWNMFLALVALDFSVLTYFSRKSLLAIIFSIFWLFFYPNTFYMVTDIVHMHFTSTVLWERESMILFMLYVPSIFFGVFSGVLSVEYIFNWIKWKNIFFQYISFAALSFISSFAIHIGRYARLNSWDIFTRPMTVVDEILAVVNREALPFILGFTFIQFMCLVFMSDVKVEGPQEKLNKKH